MKKFLFVLLCANCLLSQAQLTVKKENGGSVITKLGMGVSVNQRSTLNRDWIIINDAKCPIQLDMVGVTTSYINSGYRFGSSGNLVINEPIVGFEINHVLYNIFGEHIKSLANTEVSDLSGSYDLKGSGSWYATENEVSEYLSCVSYIVAVKTAAGVIWRYNPDAIKQELSKIQIEYEEGYRPRTSAEK